jgi:hypothetical protein
VLAPGERLVIARNPAAFAVRYPSVPGSSVIGPFTSGKLSDSGERITLLDAGGGIIRSFAYGDSAPWPSSADGDGPSLVLMRPETLPDPALPQNWRHSALPNGNPGSSDTITFAAWKTANTIASDTADLDLDDASNFLEYARGTDPRVPDAARVSAHFDDNGRLVVEFTRRIGADDVTFEPQLATNPRCRLGAQSRAPRVCGRRLQRRRDRDRPLPDHSARLRRTRSLRARAHEPVSFSRSAANC